MVKLSDLLSAGARFGLHVRTDGSLKREDCHIFDALTVKMVVLAAMSGGGEGERSLLKIVVSVLACVESHAGLCAVSVGENLRLGRALASIAHPAILKDLLRRTFLRELSGLESLCVLEYFRFRLAAIIGGSSFDNMPRLREVIDFKFVSAFFSFSGTGVSMCGNVWSWSALF